MAIELATAYVSLVPSTRGIKKAIQDEFSGVEGIAEKSGNGIGAKLTTGITTAVKGLAVGGGVGAALFAGSALKKGWDRLTTIENATARLTNQLGSASKAGKFTAEILKTVTGTPFNLDQFLDAGADLNAMGVAAQKVPGYLTAIGNAAAGKGKRANEFAGRLADQFGKVTTQGRITGDTLNQMGAAGVNATAILANSWGVSTEELRDMVSKGLIPAEAGLDALAKGINEGTDGLAGKTRALGGNMEALRKTATGAVGGLGAALARLGASALKPVLPLITTGATALAGALDSVTSKIGPMITQFLKSDQVKAVLADVKAFITGIDFGAIFSTVGSFLTGTLIPAAKQFAPVVGNIIDFGKSLAGAGQIAASVLAPALKIAVPLVAGLVGAVTGFLAAVPPGAIAAVVAGFVGFKAVQGGAKGINALGDAVDNAKKSFSTAKDTFSAARGNLKRFADFAKGTGSGAFKSISKAASGVKGAVTTAATSLASGAKAAAAWAASGLTTAANWAKATAATVAHKVAQVASTAATKIAAAAQWLWNAAMTANPIGLIVAAIAALIAGLVLAYNKVGWFRDFVDAAFRFIGNLVTGVINFIKTHWQTIFKILAAPILIAVKVVTGGWDLIKTAFLTVVKWIGEKVAAIVGFVKSIPDRIRKTVAIMWNGLKDGITAAKDWVSDKIATIIDIVRGIGKKIGDIAGMFTAPFKAAFNAIAGLWNDTIGEFSVTIPDWMPVIGGKKFNFPNMPKLHQGGTADGRLTGHEVVAKLLRSETVLTASQMSQLGSAVGNSGLASELRALRMSLTDVSTPIIVNETASPRATAEQIALRQRRRSRDLAGAF